jgi:anti-anti-sigma factor
MLNYAFREYEGNKVIELSGSLTSSTIEKFLDIVVNFIDKESIIINVENLSLVTTAGLKTLVDISYEAKEHEKRVIILWPNNDLMKIAEELGFYHHLIFADSFEEADTKIKFFT